MELPVNQFSGSGQVLLSTLLLLFFCARQAVMHAPVSNFYCNLACLHICLSSCLICVLMAVHNSFFKTLLLLYNKAVQREMYPINISSLANLPPGLSSPSIGSYSFVKQKTKKEREGKIAHRCDTIFTMKVSLGCL